MFSRIQNHTSGEFFCSKFSSPRLRVALLRTTHRPFTYSKAPVIRPSIHAVWSPSLRVTSEFRLDDLTNTLFVNILPCKIQVRFSTLATNRMLPYKSRNTLMSLFQTILASIENPDHAGSPQDLHGLLNLAQMIPGVQGAQQQLQPILGVLGSHLQDALNEQQQTNGQAAVQQTVSNLSQPGAGVQEIINLFGQDRFDGLIGEISKRTGLNSQLILQLLPLVLRRVIKMLATGTHQTNPQAENPVLNHFLGSGQNGGTMLTEAFQLASTFLHR